MSQLGDAMLFRSMLGLAAVVFLLPPATNADAPAPDVSIWQAAAAARALATDAASVCERNPSACETSREALALLHRKFETGAGIVAVGIERGRGAPADAVSPGVDTGTLTEADMDPAWAAPLPKSRN